ncbi:30S ribosomal protein S20 [Eggerthellaceae bacterium zg-887]|uniref:30S ribosomal protein S20 n=1 Tax=Xiamenia xianingshaonis TaxID=2682776 RepID=UPI00140B418C|nr:30S ribosomal protein S20 [Xiamenia xianingshaonis]NHM15656.1 30S ribosomal protein S20 [Xiamenia xianingshaonis]
MANIKSQKKRNITNEKRRLRNRMVKSQLKTATRRVKDAVAEADGAKAYAAACEACRLMDKAATKGVIHKRQAANRKSGIMHLVNPLVTDADVAAYQKAKAEAPKKPQGTGSKKKAAEAARKEAMAARSAEKAKRRDEHNAKVAAAMARKAKEAEAAAKAEAEAAAAAAAEGEGEEAAE